jgi:DNA-binding XRE family transcriptional regulator
MQLSEFMTAADLTPDELAALLEVERWTVVRYLEKGRVPQPEIVERIYEISGGRVQPNDLYPGLSQRIARKRSRRAA